MRLSLLGSFSFRSTAHRPACGLLLFALLLLVASAAADAQDALSDSLSGPIGDSVYSESVQTGPSNSLIEGDANLLTPFLRSGISDPLGFLIESGSLSPYTPQFSAITNYATAELPNQLLTDSTTAGRLAEYRDNRILMGGAGAASTRAGRAVFAASSGVPGAASARTAGAGSAAFAGVSLRAPFAAGSSALAARQTDASGFVDPNALVAAATSSPSLAAAGAGAAAVATGQRGAGSATTPSDGSLSAAAATSAGSLASAVPAAGQPPYGPGPGELFPDVSQAGPSSTGFPDSTMGTAGLRSETEDESSSPLASTHFSSGADPFKNLSADLTRYLNPTLLSSAGGVSTPPVPLSEITRRARLHTMIYSPDAPLPSPFEQRKMERAYLRQNTGRHVSHLPDFAAPTIKP